MKDRNIIVGIVVMICVTVLCALYVFYNTPMDDNIKNINWYRYDIKTGVYNKLLIEDNELTYLNNNHKFEECSKYSYNTRFKTITLDCDKKIVIKDVKEYYIVLNIDDGEEVFFKSTEESLNYEFENYYEQSIIEYEDSKSEVKEILKVNLNKINEIINSREKNILIFEGDLCNNIDCILLLGVLEKWNVDSKNVYYIYSNNINNNYINGINQMFSEFSDLYNSNYPLIITIEDSKITNSELFKCKGLNCTAWKNYAK